METSEIKGLTDTLRGRRNRQLRALRRREAMTRQAERDKRTPQEQLARLDKILGADQGAKRERARLYTQIAALNRKSS